MSIEEDNEARELWWIYSPLTEPWANLRLATFSKSINGTELFVIHNEVGGRIGIRVWHDVAPREKWIKVRRIEPPTSEDVQAALLEQELAP